MRFNKKVKNEEYIMDEEQKNNSYSYKLTPYPRLRRLRRERTKRHITQREIAEFLGVSTQYYSQVERGVNTLSFDNALRISKYFHISLEELFEKDYDYYRKLKKRGYQ